MNCGGGNNEVQSPSSVTPVRVKFDPASLTVSPPNNVQTDKVVELDRVTGRPTVIPPKYKETIDPLLKIQAEYDEGVQVSYAAIEDLTVYLGLTLAQAGGGFTPPDLVGDVGPLEYVQMTNGRLPGTAVLLLDKIDGTVLVGPFRLGDIAPDETLCDVQSKGDLIVLYDQNAERWILTDFLERNSNGF